MQPSKDSTRGDSYESITEYAKQKQVDVRVINGYISAHREEFRGHIAKDKKGAALDLFAIEQLDIYIDSRPDHKRGARFKMYVDEYSKNIDRKANEVNREIESDIIYDAEQGVDIPDRDDDVDDRISITAKMPSKNRRKSSVVNVKYSKYARPHKNQENKIDTLEDKPKIRDTHEMER